MKREFLMLAHTWEKGKDNYCGYFISEKLDGIRCFWDGGISRGKPCAEIPWANTQRDSRLVEIPIATGLWTRYAKPIQAPDWFLRSLPMQPMDGELTMGRDTFQQTLSCIRRFVPDNSEWKWIRYMIFDSPDYKEVFRDGVINTTNFKKTFKNIPLPIGGLNESCYFKRLKFLRDYFQVNQFPHCSLLDQIVIPTGPCEFSDKFIEDYAERIVRMGGEGAMIRDPMSSWEPKRSRGLLKVKPLKDDEAVIVGFTWGDLPDNTRTVSGDATGKLLGKMGSIRCRWKGIEFDLSGFTDAERMIADKQGSIYTAVEYGKKHPGESIDMSRFASPEFSIGNKITFKYRGLTDDGKPKEARYWRKHEGV